MSSSDLAKTPLSMEKILEDFKHKVQKMVYAATTPSGTIIADQIPVNRKGNIGGSPTIPERTGTPHNADAPNVVSANNIRSSQLTGSANSYQDDPGGPGSIAAESRYIHRDLLQWMKVYATYVTIRYRTTPVASVDIAASSIRKAVVKSNNVDAVVSRVSDAFTATANTLGITASDNTMPPADKVAELIDECQKIWKEQCLDKDDNLPIENVGHLLSCHTNTCCHSNAPPPPPPPNNGK